MRAPNGAGEVSKLSGHRRKPYVAKVTVGWESYLTSKGEEKLRRIHRVVGYYETRQEGRDALVFYRHGPVIAKADITLGELYEEWAEDKYKNVGRDTANNYRAAWKYISPLEPAKVTELRAGHIQSIINDCHGSGLSRSSLEKIKILAVLLLNYATENDITTKNYAKFIKLPRMESPEKERFTDLEIKQLFKMAGDNEWIATILIKIYTGFRISELLAITPFNINIEEGVITGGSKTAAGKNRVVPINRKIKPFVLAWLNKGGETLICDDKLKKISAKRYREKFYYPALKAAKTRKLTPHACRHTFASLMAEAGVKTLSIQKLIGHSDYAFTANNYSHPEIESLRKAIDLI